MARASRLRVSRSADLKSSSGRPSSQVIDKSRPVDSSGTTSGTRISVVPALAKMSR